MFKSLFWFVFSSELVVGAGDMHKLMRERHTQMRVREELAAGHSRRRLLSWANNSHIVLLPPQRVVVQNVTSYLQSHSFAAAGGGMEAPSRIWTVDHWFWSFVVVVVIEHDVAAAGNFHQRLLGHCIVNRAVSVGAVADLQNVRSCCYCWDDHLQSVGNYFA